jgi:hypothetical protein
MRRRRGVENSVLVSPQEEVHSGSLLSSSIRDWQRDCRAHLRRLASAEIARRTGGQTMIEQRFAPKAKSAPANRFSEDDMVAASQRVNARRYA